MKEDVIYYLKNISQIPGITCKKPSGAFYVIAKLPIKDAEDFAKWMLTEFNHDNKTVMFAPAEGFYMLQRFREKTK